MQPPASNRFAQQTGTTAVSDAKLVEAFRDQKDASAYSELVRRHQIGVYRLLSSLLSDPDRAEPACEDVFVRAAHRLTELPDPEQFAPWVSTLAAQLADEREALQAPAPRRSTTPLAFDATLAPDEGKAVMRRAVRDVLSSLPAEHRSVLILAELHREPVEKIAETLAIAPREVRRRLAAARKGFVAAFSTKRKQPRPTPPKPAAKEKTTVVQKEPLSLAPGYSLGPLLGAGGMAQVFLAQHEKTQRYVALKVVAPQLATMPGIRERFDREALAMQQVRHPNLVEFVEQGRTTDGGLFLAMERLVGQELFDMISAGITPDVALHILRHVLVALDCLHQRDIIHRDVKPENVFIVKSGDDRNFAKLIDLGIARLPSDVLRENAEVRLTKFGTVLGTPAYVAPEQAVGREIDPRADLYAASVMLFEMLTGRLPFVSNDVGSLLAMHVSAPPPRLREVAGHLPAIDELQALLDTGLAKYYEDRYADAREYLQAVDQVAAALG